jgi:4a-hydroxytetrahydrobiopterin dehydratase
MELANESCEACHADAPRVQDEEVDSLLAAIPEWELVTIRNVPRLKRVIRVEGWEAAVALTNRIADIASQQDHHPSILTEWGKVTVQWWTHSIGGLHRNDFVMAAKVNDLVRIN